MDQEILSALDSDEVNSISDTVESMQVATIIRSVFYDLATDLGLPEHETLFELNASGTVARPCLMTIPDNVVTMRSVKYDTKLATETLPSWTDIQYLPFEEFLRWVEGYRGNTDVVLSQDVTFNGEEFPILYRNDRAPSFYTTADDRQVLFDAYDSTIDSTLQKSKTLCMGNVYPVFLMEDSFIPDLDPSQFSLLKNKAKTRAFYELKQQENTESASEMRRQKIVVQKRKRKVQDEPEINKVPRYGRK